MDVTGTPSQLKETLTPDLAPEVAFAGRALRILTFSSVFSNAAELRRSSRVQDRIRGIARAANVEVMAPVAWSPWAPGAPLRRHQSHGAPLQSVKVHQPRFLALPRLLKATEPACLILGCAPALLALRRRSSGLGASDSRRRPQRGSAPAALPVITAGEHENYF